MKQALRVVHITPSYWPAVRYGGTVTAVHGLCSALAALGEDVDIYTTNVDGLGVSEVPVDRVVKLDGVNIHYSPVGLGRRIYRSPLMKVALRKRINVADIVHIHAVFLWPGWMAARNALANSVPYVVSPHGMLVPELIRGRSRVAKEMWIRLVERRTLASAAAIHVTAESEAAGIRTLGLDLAPLISIPNGINIPDDSDPELRADHPAWADLPRERRLLYLGRISWKKGLENLLAALPHISHTHLVVAGNDDEGLTPRLKSQASELGVGDRVRFIGPVDGTRKWALLNGAGTLVLPSRNENFGIVVLEALAMGTPVVLTEGVGAAELVLQARAGIVAGNDPNELAAAISFVLSNPTRRREMGERGRTEVRRHYSWSSVAKRMTEAYRDVIATSLNQRRELL